MQYHTERAHQISFTHSKYVVKAKVILRLAEIFESWHRSHKTFNFGTDIPMNHSFIVFKNVL